MLTPEQARDELQRVAVDDFARRQARRGLLLVGDAAAAAQALRNRAGRHTSPEDTGRMLDALSPRARGRVFQSLHPALGDVIEQAWLDLRRAPYPQGYTRHAFRAPRHPEVTAAARARWLSRLLSATERYERPVSWFVGWAGHLGYEQYELGQLFGVAVDHGDSEVYDLLQASVSGGHEIAMMGRHVPIALLSCAQPDAWATVERLLLSAQRQEGLRQVILEAVDLAHPMAFRRMLRLVVEQGLTRFAATVRAAGVWFGEPFEVTDRKILDALLIDLLDLLDDAAARAAALAGPDPGRVYLALWAIGFDDAVAAAGQAATVARHSSADHRLAAVRLLASLELPQAHSALVQAVNDEDLRVVAVAVGALPPWQAYDDETAAAMRRLLDRLNQSQHVQVGLWKPQQLTLKPTDVADNLAHGHGNRPAQWLGDVVDRMSTTGRQQYARLLAHDPRRHRDALLELVGDRAQYVRSQALDALAKAPAPMPTEAPALEALLRRRSGDVRRGVITLLLRQADMAAVQSCGRLLAGAEAQIEAGRELVRELRAAGRASSLLPAEDSVDSDQTPSESGSARHPATDTPYTLVDHDARTPARRPEGSLAALEPYQPGIGQVLTSLDAWLLEHRDVEVRVESWGEEGVQLISDLRWLRGPDPHEDWRTQAERFPLRELVEPWWERTGPQLSADGLEAFLAWPAVKASTQVLEAQSPHHYLRIDHPRWLLAAVGAAGHLSLVKQLKFAPILDGLLSWLAVREARAEWIDPLLDAASATLAAVPQRAGEGLPSLAEVHAAGYDAPGKLDWRLTGLCAWVATANELEAIRPELFSPRQRGRLWQLARFVDEPQGTYDPRSGGREDATAQYAGDTRPTKVPRRPARSRPPLQLAVRAVEDAVASRADVAELLVGEWQSGDDNAPGVSRWIDPLGELTRRRPPDWLQSHRWLADMVDVVRARVIDAEAGRGELSTPYTPMAARLRSAEGADTVVRLLAGLGRQKLVRGYVWSGDTKAGSLSRLIRQCFPAADENPEQFAVAAKARGVGDQRLLELAVYAPQWAPLVEEVLGYLGLVDAVYWLHAHTKDDQWQVDEDVRAQWAADISERTALAATDLLVGAVDVEWLTHLRLTLGDERLDELLKVAKYASSSGGHKRAELYIHAVRGDLFRTELSARINHKREQDAVRALGLLPLPDEERARRDQVLATYEFLHEWRRQGRTFGQQRRTSEALAVRIGIENLARTAGYRDPQRLTWAMEAEAVRDLSAGPITVVEGDISVTLSLNEGGAPELEVRRGERTLASVPKGLQSDERVTELKERVKTLKQQAKRMRASLEEAAIRGDRFTLPELRELMAHPMLAPVLRTLVFVTDEGLYGFPRGEGQQLEGHDGAEREADGSPVRLAHPVDLLASGDWPAWQRACFSGRIRQSFKQVFRELYVPTAVELDGAKRSERYTGHQVNSRQAIALLASRGWVVAPDEGALRTFHDEKLTARLDVLGGLFTPAEVEGMTISDIWFTGIGEWESVALDTVPARLFSEVMRDLDLVVSVAHAGGVDPEATASTVEMRSALVGETAALLRLDNVELTDHHAIVTGKLGTYSVHLGSGVVHRRPGNSLCIVPVSAQHRGRLFLPFADDDPRTAEVVSKVLLLARDHLIKDPTILEQLRA